MRNCFKLTDKQKNIIIGSLLGDGTIEYSNRSFNLKICRSLKDLIYLKWEMKELQNILTREKPGLYRVFDKRNEKYYDGCYFRTKSCENFKQYRELWYKDKIKIIPLDLKLNAEILAIWFADDGSITITGKNATRLKLSTHSFSEEEQEFLIKLIHQTCGVIFKKYFDKSCDKWILLCTKTSESKKFLRFIDGSFPDLPRKSEKWRNDEFDLYEKNKLRLSCIKCENKFPYLYFDKKYKYTRYLCQICKYGWSVKNGVVYHTRRPRTKMST